MKFKVGDYVRVKSLEATERRFSGYVSETLKIGDIGIIDEICGFNIIGLKDLFYHSDDLELVDKIDLLKRKEKELKKELERVQKEIENESEMVLMCLNTKKGRTVLDQYPKSQVENLKKNGWKIVKEHGITTEL